MNAWLAAATSVLVLMGTWLLANNGVWWRRLPLVTASVVLAFGLWLSVPDTAGYPTSAPMPAHAGFVWGLIDEPDPQTGDKGRIFLWLDVGKSRPRAFTLPYTRQLHRQVQAAMNATRHGQRVDVARAKKRGRHGRGRGAQPGGAYRFYPHPQAGLPAKG
jgi:hypothetical protein